MYPFRIVQQETLYLCPGVMQNELEAIRGQAYGRLGAGLVVVGEG